MDQLDWKLQEKETWLEACTLNENIYTGRVWFLHVWWQAINFLADAKFMFLNSKWNIWHLKGMLKMHHADKPT
jgi:hypothetical protein